MNKGRPKGPVKVVFKRRVLPEKVPALMALLKEARIPDSSAVKIVESLDRRGSVLALEKDLSGDSMVNVKMQVKALLDDIDRLTKEVEAQKELNRKLARMSDDEKFHVLLKKYDDLRRSLANKGEFDQA